MTMNPKDSNNTAMRQTPFLYSVAEAYIENESDNLIDYCFVFPNKRSATFFIDYLEIISRERMRDRQFIPPCTATVVELTESFNETCQVERMEAIFILFDVYRGVLRRKSGDSEADSLDFNRFVYWADLLINDFDDVDNALADPDEVFRNVETLKEISANYLTAEQIEVIRQYWSDEHIPQDVQQFWNHIAHPCGDSDAKASVGFLKLWQVMKDVYHGFRNRLREAGLHTPGMAARHAAEKIMNSAPSEFDCRRYVFVGFNNLSKAEQAIMARLGELTDEETGTPMGDFYWDLAAPVFHDRHTMVGGQVKKYARMFRSLYDCVSPLSDYPAIEITGLPSRVAQAKMMGAVLDIMFPDSDDAGSEEPQASRQERLRRTAIILPDENLLTPLINSIPPQVTPLNITMGYKLRNTAVAGLIRDIVAMQMRAYRSQKEGTFFYEDVNKVLSNPLIRLTHPIAAMKALEEIQQKRLFNVPEAMFVADQYKDMAPVFEMVVNKKNIDQVFSYIERLLDWAEQTARTFVGIHGQDESHEETEVENRVDAGNAPAAMQLAFIRRYRNAVWHIRMLMREYLGEQRTFVEDNTLFNMIERLTAGEMLNFDGMPLKGLQIMGVLEARSLDFDTLILPSMNERIFPRGKFNGSFIPMILRNAYGLPTSETQENAFAYFFYRMISRARKVIIFYDARTTGTKSSQMSRYIHQLLHLYRPKGMKLNVVPFRLTSPEKPSLEVVKSPQIMSELNRFVTPGGGRRLSASSIKKYLACPMSFYLENIADFREDDEMRDWIDESTYGTIVHEVFENMYEKCRQKYGCGGAGVTVTAEILDEMIRDSQTLGREIMMSIKRNYLKCDANDPAPLVGEAKMYAYFISEIVRKVFQREKRFAPFVYLQGEWTQPGKDMRLEIRGTEGRCITVNFTARIDRIDRIDSDGLPRLRVIDYKTGSDKLMAPDLDAMFHNYDNKAFLQLMLYCQAYAQETGYDGPIQPLIYSTKALMIRDVEPLKTYPPSNEDEIRQRNPERVPTRKNSKWAILDYRDYVTEFNDKLIGELERLFDPSVPFTRTTNDDDCRYCQFKELCQSDKQI